jgi:hypothetical protein
MQIDFGSLATMGVLLIAPAVIVFTIATMIRVRRGRMHRQRITKNKSGKRA